MVLSQGHVLIDWYNNLGYGVYFNKTGYIIDSFNNTNDQFVTVSDLSFLTSSKESEKVITDNGVLSRKEEKII